MKQQPILYISYFNSCYAIFISLTWALIIVLFKVIFWISTNYEFAELMCMLLADVLAAL